MAVWEVWGVWGVWEVWEVWEVWGVWGVWETQIDSTTQIGRGHLSMLSPESGITSDF